MKLFNLIQTVGFFEALDQIQGSPYSLIYYDASQDKVYFTRDVLGRRSLLRKERGGSNPFWVLTSTAPSEMEGEWEEVSADGIHELDLSKLSDGKGWIEAVKVHERCYRSEAKNDTLEALVGDVQGLSRCSLTVTFDFPLDLSLWPLESFTPLNRFSPRHDPFFPSSPRPLPALHRQNAHLHRPPHRIDPTKSPHHSLPSEIFHRKLETSNSSTLFRWTRLHSRSSIGR